MLHVFDMSPNQPSLIYAHYHVSENEGHGRLARYVHEIFQHDRSVATAPSKLVDTLSFDKGTIVGDK